MIMGVIFFGLGVDGTYRVKRDGPEVGHDLL